MKPHLSIALLSFLSVASLAQAVEIPDGYEQINLKAYSYLRNYTSNTADDMYAFLLCSDMAFTPATNTTWTSSSPLVKGGNLLFTKAEGYDSIALSFSNGSYSVFENPTSLTFDTLSNLTITSQKSEAAAVDMDVAGQLHIRNVSDGEEGTVDVVISNNKGGEQGCVISTSRSSSVIDIINNGDVIFLDNTSSNNSDSANSTDSFGGAIYSSGSICVNNNENVNFLHNCASTYYKSSYSSYSYGGCLYSIGVININNNKGAVNFVGNCANTKTDFYYADSSYSYGGAIYASTDIGINNNVNVSFLENNSSSSSSFASVYSYGGAVYSLGDVEINNDGDVCFAENYVSATTSSHFYSISSLSCGGAIYLTGNLSIQNNADVSFLGNYSYSSCPYYATIVAKGGAIYSTGSFSIRNNENVNFSGNYAYSAYNANSSSHGAFGGAIYSTGKISIIGNNNVIFDKNYQRGDSYHLRSIHLTPDSDYDILELGAKTSGHIIFYDSVYMSNYSGAIVSLNADYEDANGVTQKATGDIVFSGKYTEEHLKEVKGSAGTSTEIANSRTSELLNTVNLYCGTLRVEDKAVLKTHAINVAADGNATMKVLDAEVNASTYDVTINSTGQLTLGGTTGSAKLTAKNININSGATLAVERTELVDTSSVITLAVSETVSIFNEKLGGVASGNLNLAAGSSYKADGAHLGVINGTLTFNATEDEKINLILTLGAEYDKDSQVILFTDVNTVKFVLDNITASKTGQVITLNAADYFTGDWINENTSLVYDKGTIYVTGVNRVIPEPTTATLSLLALAGLVARRRR